MITSCNHSENIICGSCLMKNHQEKQVAENLLRGELLTYSPWMNPRGFARKLMMANDKIVGQQTLHIPERITQGIQTPTLSLN